MSELVANSFPELAYLVMREKKDQRFFHLRELVDYAKELAIKIEIESRFRPFSADWIEQLNGGMKRDSGANNAVNEGQFCIFVPENNACTEPWGLASDPLYAESYQSFRSRNRGEWNDKRKSSRAKEEEKAFLAQKATLVCVLGDPLYIITPAEGDGRHFICLFDSAVEYRNADNVTHRDGDSYAQPAYFDWSGTVPAMRFCQNGKDHRLDGPAHLSPEKNEDVFVVASEDCGELTEPQTIKMFAGLYRRFTGQSLPLEEMERLRLGNYRDFSFFEDELAQVRRLHALYVNQDDGAAVPSAG